MKALFFLRHYNDIDHITPIIHKWLEAGHTCDIVFIAGRQFLADYRIKYLGAHKGVRIAHIRDVLPPVEYLKWRLQMLLLVQGLRRHFIGPAVAALANIYHAERRRPLWESTARRLLDRTFEDDARGVVTFDWVYRNTIICVEWIETVIKMARARGFGSVSLPHGDSPHVNQLIRRQELRPGADRTYSAAAIFDVIAVPNELCAKRFRPFLDDAAIAVPGSPRYCEEWTAKLKTLLPPSPLRHSDNLKVVMFLRNAKFTTFWEEVGIVVRMLAAFKGLELMIKPHTRSGLKQSLTKDASLLRLPNVNVAGDGAHSAHLVDWADVIIDLATSAAFEAVGANKPVLAADYLHAGRSTVAHYMPETELCCRDDVHEKIDKLLRFGCNNFYVEEHRQRFIHEMLHAEQPDVLSRYAFLLEGLTRNNQVRENPHTS